MTWEDRCPSGVRERMVVSQNYCCKEQVWFDILTYSTCRALVNFGHNLMTGTCHPLASVKTGNFSSSLVRQRCSGISGAFFGSLMHFFPYGWFWLTSQSECWSELPPWQIHWVPDRPYPYPKVVVWSLAPPGTRGVCFKCWLIETFASKECHANPRNYQRNTLSEI